MSLAPKDRIVFPLDLPSAKEALNFVEILKDDVGVFKIGLELFIAEGPRVIADVKSKAPDSKIFLDLKLHDIPETVRRAAMSLSGLGVDFTTVHADGKRMLEAAVDGAGSTTKILAVTVLTSQSKEDLLEAGIEPAKTEPGVLVTERAVLARKAGCHGVISSPLEVKNIRDATDSDFIVMTPGVRPADSVMDDQRRVATPRDAIKNGSNYIVVGRPIRRAEDPSGAARAIAKEIERALS